MANSNNVLRTALDADLTDARLIGLNAAGDLSLFDGDQLKAAYDHSQVAHAPDDAQKNSDITRLEVADKFESVQALGSVSGSVEIDTDDGDATMTITDATTLTITGTIPAGGGRTVALHIMNGGTNVTWPESVKWPAGEEPELSADGTDLVVLYTVDGGTTWLGVSALEFS